MKFQCVEDGYAHVNCDLIQLIKIEPCKKGDFYQINIYVLGLKTPVKYAVYQRFGDAQIALNQLTYRIMGKV